MIDTPIGLYRVRLPIVVGERLFHPGELVELDAALGADYSHAIELVAIEPTANEKE